MPSSRQESDFVSFIIPSNILSEAIAWIADNLDPEDIFDEKELKQWADNNGYVKEDA